MGISLEKVSYSYIKSRKHRKYVVKDVSLNIEDKDEFIALVGETGSGKSTLATLFNALKTPTEGIATINGVKLKKVHRRKDHYNAIRKHVGLVFQFPDYQLFEETVLKDVMFGPKNFGHKNDAKELAEKALRMVRLPEDKWMESPFSLSGGEKKMASIAGIIASDPDILVLDEPIAGLDPENKNKLLEILEDLNKSEHKSIVMIVHDMNTVYRYAKRVLVMNRGNLVFDGTPYDLFINNEHIVKECKLDEPDTVRIAKELNKLCGLSLDISKKTIDELAEEIIHG